MFAYYGGQNQAGQLVGQGASQAAAISAEGSQNFSNQLGLAALALAKGYADRQSEEAKGKAYQQFLKVAGPQMGVPPELMQEMLAMPPRQAAQVDGPMNQLLQHNLQMRYLDARTAAKGGGGSSGGGGGAEAAGGGGIQL